MKKRKEIVFAVVSVVIVAAALVYTFFGMRSVGPRVDYHEFPIVVTYEEHGETKTREVIYCAYYLEREGSWSAYYEDSGMEDITPMDSYSNGEWAFVLQLDAGYLMGDPAYADVYAGGFPEPTITYYDEEWNEYTGVTEAAPLGIKLIGCEYPEPIENGFVDTGVELDHAAVAVLTALAALILILGVVLVKKDAGVVYQRRDKEARIFNIVILCAAVPLLFAVGPEWGLIPEEGIDSILSALLAPATVLGVCASILLRRKGTGRAGMAVQFVGPVVFLYLFCRYLLVGFGGYSLFLAVGALVGAIIAVCAGRGESTDLTRLDKVSVATNALLIPVYLYLSLPMLLLGGIIGANADGGIALKILCYLLSFVVAAVPVYCGAALGMSAALRKKGRSLAGFLIQFAGFGGFLFSVLVVLVCDLIPGIDVSIN